MENGKVEVKNGVDERWRNSSSCQIMFLDMKLT